MSQSLDKLIAQVAELQTVETSAVALIVGLKQALDDARNNADPAAALDDLSARIGQATNDLAAAISANTDKPAEPAPTGDAPTA
jgi:hypothetical protein